MNHSVIKERVTVCGEYLISQLYPSRPLSGNKARRKKYRTSRDVQKRLNAKNSRRRLTALVHQNFTPYDVIASLTYDSMHLPKDEKEAHAAMYNFIRRFKRAWSKATGKPETAFRYIEVLEVGHKGRIHHHVLLSGGVELPRITDIWRNGDVHAEYANFDENGLTGFVRYILKDSRRVRYKRWSASRNLEQPQITTRDDVMTVSEAQHINADPLGSEYILAQLHPGYTVCPFSVETSTFDGQCAPYISCMLYRSIPTREGWSLEQPQKTNQKEKDYERKHQHRRNRSRRDRNRGNRNTSRRILRQ